MVSVTCYCKNNAKMSQSGCLKSDIFAKLRPSPSQIQFQFRDMITPILILSSNPAWPPDPQGQKIFTK